MAAESVAYRRLLRIWTALPSGPLSEERLRDAIIAAGNLYEGDWAGAESIILEFRAGKAILVRVGDDGETVWEKASQFPTFVDNGPGSAGYNAELAAGAAWEREREERSRRIAEENHRALNASVDAENRRAVNELIDGRLRELGLLPPIGSESTSVLRRGAAAVETLAHMATSTRG